MNRGQQALVLLTLGAIVALVSHAPEAGSFADRVLRMQDGRLLP